MLISITSNRPKRWQPLQRGVTLVEVLIVGLILGVVASVVVLTVDPGPSEPEAAAYKFGARLQEASKTAVLTGSIIGIDVSATRDSYAFQQYRDRRWGPLLSDRNIFSSEEVPETVQMRIIPPAGAEEKSTDESERISFDFSTSFDKMERKVPPPELLFFPTGGVPTAEVTFADQNELWRVTITDNGRLDEAVQVILVR